MVYYLCHVLPFSGTGVWEAALALTRASRFFYFFVMSGSNFFIPSRIPSAFDFPFSSQYSIKIL